MAPIRRARRDDLPGAPDQSVPIADASNNAAALFAEASRQGIEPQAVVGNHLLTTSDETGCQDCHRAWTAEETPSDPAGAR